MLTARQAEKQVRNQGVGASEVAAVLGLDPWRSAWDLWAMKTEKHEESERGADATEAQDIGNLIEDTTAALAERRLGVRLVKPTATYRADNGFMFANLDRQVERAMRGAANCELKSTGIADGWGDEGTDQVPERVLLQVTAQMVCSGSDFSHVARLLGRFGFSFAMYAVPFNPTLGRIVEDRVGEFWNNHVVRDIPPTDSLPSIGVVSHIRRTPGKVIDLRPAVVAEFAAAKAARKDAEEKEERAKAGLLAALGDAEGGKCAGWSVSFKAVNTKRLDTDALKSALPDTYAKFVQPSTYRKLDVRETKQ